MRSSSSHSTQEARAAATNPINWFGVGLAWFVGIYSFVMAQVINGLFRLAEARVDAADVERFVAAWGRLFGRTRARVA